MNTKKSNNDGASHGSAKVEKEGEHAHLPPAAAAAPETEGHQEKKDQPMRLIYQREVTFDLTPDRLAEAVNALVPQAAATAGLQEMGAEEGPSEGARAAKEEPAPPRQEPRVEEPKGGLLQGVPSIGAEITPAGEAVPPRQLPLPLAYLPAPGSLPSSPVTTPYTRAAGSAPATPTGARAAGVPPGFPYRSPFGPASSPEEFEARPPVSATEVDRTTREEEEEKSKAPHRIGDVSPREAYGGRVGMREERAAGLEEPLLAEEAGVPGGTGGPLEHKGNFWTCAAVLVGATLGAGTFSFVHLFGRAAKQSV
jgi:hypothetical protein